MTTETPLTHETLVSLVERARERHKTDAEFEVLYAEYCQGKQNKRLLEVMKERGSCSRPIEKTIQAEFKKRLAAASEAGLLRPADPVDGSTIFHDIWTPLLEKGWSKLPDYRHDDISEALAQSLVGAIVYNKKDPLDAQTAATQIMAHLEAGSLPDMHGHGDIFQNFADGAKVSISMTAWAPELYTKNKDGEREALRSMPDGLAFHQTVEFPSGRILVSDSVRVDPLPNILEQIRSTLRININYAEQRVKRTAINAMIGVVEVAVGSDGPNIVRVPGSQQLFAGQEDDRFETAARVCNDYWGTMLIDRETLIKLAISDEDAPVTREDVEAEIDAWLAGSEYASEVVITPGTYHLYWDDDRETLSKALAEAGHTAPEDTRFVLSPERIALPAEILRDYEKIEEKAA